MLLVQAFPIICEVDFTPLPPKISYGVTLWAEKKLSEIFLVTSRLT